jgi:hypothetical protein
MNKHVFSFPALLEFGNKRLQLLMRRSHRRVHWSAFANEAVQEREAAFQESARRVCVAKFVLEQPKLVATDDDVPRRLARLRIVSQQAFANL